MLFFNELVRVIWGPAGKSIAVPAFLGHTVQILPGVPYPPYRFALIVAGLAVALLLAWLVARTRVGMLIRAGASNRRMIGALGINIQLLFSLVFGLGAVFAGLAGLRTPRGLITMLLLIVLAVLPVLTQAFDQRYLLSIGTRIVIWAIAAIS